MTYDSKKMRLDYISSAVKESGRSTVLDENTLHIKDGREHSLHFWLRFNKSTRYIQVYLGVWLKLDQDKVSTIKDEFLEVIRDSEGSLSITQTAMSAVMRMQAIIPRLAWDMFRTLFIRLARTIVQIDEAPEYTNYYTVWFKPAIFSLRDRRHDALFINLVEIAYNIRAKKMVE